MTVTSTTAISGPYDGNDATVTFDYTFAITAESELKVTLTDEDGVDTVQTLTTHYSVTIGDDGTGTFTMVTAPATGEQVTATMQVEGTQETDLLNYGAFNAEVIEDALDKLTRLYLQLSERVDRCLKLGQSDESDPADVTLANFTQQAYLDTDNFSEVLSSADTSIQAAFETIDGGFGERTNALIEEAAASASATLDIVDATGSAWSIYDILIIELYNIRPATDGATLQFLISDNAGGSWGSSYDYVHYGRDEAGNAVTFEGSSASVIALNDGGGNLVSEVSHGYITFFNVPGYARISGQMSWLDTGSVFHGTSCHGKDSGSLGGISGIRIKMSAGNITSGTMRLWGVPTGS